MLAGREAVIKNGDLKDARIRQLESEVAMLCEELRINDGLMRRVPTNRRLQYTGMERMAGRSNHFPDRCAVNHTSYHATFAAHSREYRQFSVDKR